MCKDGNRKEFPNPEDRKAAYIAMIDAREDAELHYATVDNTAMLAEMHEDAIANNPIALSAQDSHADSSMLRKMYEAICGAQNGVPPTAGAQNGLMPPPPPPPRPRPQPESQQAFGAQLDDQHQAKRQKTNEIMQRIRAQADQHMQQ